ncbi:MAG: hypothetical protein U1A23_02815, partial [Candidatus Sungbacteria bacterium]|nr:hypothetical protein [Candidatus Sungbacteria bacterium]
MFESLLMYLTHAYTQLSEQSTVYIIGKLSFIVMVGGLFGLLDNYILGTAVSNSISSLRWILHII